MNKKGLWGKILLGVFIVIVLILIIIGVTAYQASQVIKVANEEVKSIQANAEILVNQANCSKLAEIETSVGKIESKVSSACKNPIIKIAVSKMENVPVKCENLTVLKADFENKFAEAKVYCENPEKFKESIANGSISKDELLALAQKYGIKI